MFNKIYNYIKNIIKREYEFHNLLYCYYFTEKKLDYNKEYFMLTLNSDKDRNIFKDLYFERINRNKLIKIIKLEEKELKYYKNIFKDYTDITKYLEVIYQIKTKKNVNNEFYYLDENDINIYFIFNLYFDIYGYDKEIMCNIYQNEIFEKDIEYNMSEKYHNNKNIINILRNEKTENLLSLNNYKLILGILDIKNYKYIKNILNLFQNFNYRVDDNLLDIYNDYLEKNNYKIKINNFSKIFKLFDDLELRDYITKKDNIYKLRNLNILYERIEIPVSIEQYNLIKFKDFIESFKYIIIYNIDLLINNSNFFNKDFFLRNLNKIKIKKDKDIIYRYLYKILNIKEYKLEYIYHSIVDENDIDKIDYKIILYHQNRLNTSVKYEKEILSKSKYLFMNKEFDYYGEDICMICRDDVKLKDREIMECKHYLCKDCYNQIDKCPLCNKSY